MSSNEWQWLLQSQEVTYCCLSYLPFLFRIAAFLTAFPFALFIALDAIAYGIARTLHLSMSQRRVPRSPLSVNSRPLAASDSTYGDSGATYSFDIPTPSEDDDELPSGLEDLSARLAQLPDQLGNEPHVPEGRSLPTKSSDLRIRVPLPKMDR